jgi:membrane protein
MQAGQTQKTIPGLAKTVWRQIHDSDLRWVAGSLAFSTVLSLVPFFALTLTLFQVFGGLDFLEPKVQHLLLQYFKEAVGQDATVVLRKTIMRLKSHSIGWTSFVFLLFTSLRLLQDIQNGINQMWKPKIKRPLLSQILTSWLLLVAITLGLAAYTGIRSLDFLKPVLNARKEVLDFCVFAVGLLLFYKMLPQEKVRWRSAIISALLAALGLVALQKSFAWITKTFFQLGKIYGSLATIPLLLMWVLILWYVILAGAALAASLEKSNDIPIQSD